MRRYQGLFAFFVLVASSFVSHGAQAQLAPGCSCPAGSFQSGNECFLNVIGAGQPVVPPVCTGDSVRSAAVQQQQLSFSSLQGMLDSRRDQLRHRHSTGTPLGFADEDNGGVLNYSPAKRTSDAFASIPFKAPVRAVPNGPSWASWAEGLGDWQKNSAVNQADLSRSTETYGAQGGVDATWQNLTAADDALVVGLVASWMTSRVTYDNSPTSVRLQGPGVGLYSTYLRGNFSTDLAVKGDFLSLDQSTGGLLPNTSLNVVNFGVSGNAQYRIATGETSFVEPTGGFSFTRTMFDNGAVAMGLKDASTLRLQAGARFGTSWTAGNTIVEPSVKLLAYNNVVAEGSSLTADTPGAAIVPTDQGKTRGEIDPQLNFNYGNGLSSNLAGQFIFGEQLVGGGLRAQLRKEW